MTRESLAAAPSERSSVTQPASNSEWDEEDSASFIRFADAFVPDRDEQAAAVSSMIGNVGNGAVLELCCGAGVLAERLLADHPDASVVGLDASTAMLVEARTRLANYSERFLAEKFDLAAHDWRTRTTAPAAVVSSLAVHHLTGSEKAELYRDLFALLRPGGAVVIADLVQPRGHRANEYTRRAWDEFVRQQGGEPYQAFHQLEWSCYEYPDPLDKPSSISEHLAWLTAAGFADADVFWMKAGHAVYGGVKPDGEAGTGRG